MEAVRGARDAFEGIMKLLQYEHYKELTALIAMIGGAMRELPQDSSSNESMAETQSARGRCYANFEQCETSDPEMWADIHYGRAGNQTKEDDEPSNGLMEF